MTPDTSTREFVAVPTEDQKFDEWFAGQTRVWQDQHFKPSYYMRTAWNARAALSTVPAAPVDDESVMCALTKLCTSRPSFDWSNYRNGLDADEAFAFLIDEFVALDKTSDTAAPVAGEDARLNRPDGCLDRYHLAKWTDADFAKHPNPVRKTIAWLLDVRDAWLAARAQPSPRLSRGQILEEAARAMCHLCDKGFGFHRSFPPHQVHEHNGEPFGRCPAAPIYSLLTQSPAALEGKALEDETIAFCGELDIETKKDEIGIEARKTADILLGADIPQMSVRRRVAAIIAGFARNQLARAPTPAPPRIDDAAVERAVQAAAEYADSLPQGSMDAPFIRSHRVGLVNAILQAFPPKER